MNMEHSPSGHLSNTGPEPGIHSRLNSPFTYIVQYYVRSTLVLLFIMSCLVIPLFALYLLLLPPLLSGRPRDRCCPLWSTTSMTTLLPFQQSFQASKPSLSILISPISFPLMLELELLLLSCDAPRPMLEKTSIGSGFLRVFHFACSFYFLHCIMSSCHHIINFCNSNK